MFMSPNKQVIFATLHFPNFGKVLIISISKIIRELSSRVDQLARSLAVSVEYFHLSFLRKNLSKQNNKAPHNGSRPQKLEHHWKNLKMVWKNDEIIIDTCVDACCRKALHFVIPLFISLVKNYEHFILVEKGHLGTYSKRDDFSSTCDRWYLYLSFEAQVTSTNDTLRKECTITLCIVPVSMYVNCLLSGRRKRA